MSAFAAPSGENMPTHLIAEIRSQNRLSAPISLLAPASLATAALALLLCLVAAGCGTPPPPQITASPTDASTNSLSLHEGDVLQIKFPGATEMDTTQTIRADGKITIANAGDVKVSGLTTDGAAQAILAAVGDQLKVKQVTVTVQSSAFIVYVTGSVLRPGKITEDRPLTVFQAVIEAGIDNAKSNLKAVEVIRTDASGKNTYKTLNLKNIIQGVPSEPFTLKSYDTIFVPEKFSAL
jgi:protein involved in polysaccharide export with SLBB domain